MVTGYNLVSELNLNNSAPTGDAAKTTFRPRGKYLLSLKFVPDDDEYAASTATTTVTAP